MPEREPLLVADQTLPRFYPQAQAFAGYRSSAALSQRSAHFSTPSPKTRVDIRPNWSWSTEAATVCRPASILWNYFETLGFMGEAFAGVEKSPRSRIDLCWSKRVRRARPSGISMIVNARSAEDRADPGQTTARPLRARGGSRRDRARSSSTMNDLVTPGDGRSARKTMKETV